MNNDLLAINWDSLRVGQRNAINTIVNLIREGQNSISIVLPPGYGKSDVMRVSGVMLMLQQLVSRALILEPAESLRHQIVDRQKMQEASDRYNLPPVLGSGIQTYEAVTAPRSPFPPTRQANAAFISMSIQMANNHRHRLVQWIQWEIREKRVPPVVFVDEAHTGSSANEWGTTIRALREAGAFTVLLTGTPYRADRRPIEGFRWEEGTTEQVRLFRRRQGADGERLVDIHEGHRTALRLIPDYEYSIRNAWDIENPPSLCKMTRLPYDFELSNYGEVSQEYRGSNTLSQLQPTQLAGTLGTLLRQDSVIESFCNGLVTHLRNRQRGFRESAAIVFVGNDRAEEGEEDNWHANRFVEILETITREFKCVIATSTTGDGVKSLQRFQEGDGDIIIVKQMGAVGYDVPRLKVMADLSVVRSPTAYVQKVCRIARVCQAGETNQEMQMTAVLLTPDDILGAALWQNFIAAQDGETSMTNTEYVETKTAEAQEQGEREYVVVDSVRPGDIYSDTNMQVSPAESLDPVSRLVSEVPILERFMTWPDVEKNLDGFRRGLGIGEEEQISEDIQSSQNDDDKNENVAESSGGAVVEDGNESQRTDQAGLTRLAGRLAEKRLGRTYRTGDPGYSRMIRDVQFEAKQAGGIPSRKPRDYTSQDIANMRRYYEQELSRDGQ